MTDSIHKGVVKPEADVGHLGSRLIHDGRVVHLSLDRVRFPDGSEGELELIRHRGASAVVPILGDPEAQDPTVVLIHQYRYAAGGFVYEIPAGIPEGGEPWEVCAARELEEETGYVAETLCPLGRIFTTPGFTNEEIHLFQATGLRPGSIQRDKDEFMEVVEIPMSRVMEMVSDGVICDAKSLTGILLLDRRMRDGL